MSTNGVIGFRSLWGRMVIVFGWSVLEGLGLADEDEIDGKGGEGCDGYWFSLLLRGAVVALVHSCFLSM